MKKKLLIYIILSSIVSVQAQLIKTVNVAVQGTLKNLITDSESKTITTLTVTGNIDSRDFAFLRDNLKTISILDLTSSSIKSYSGTEGTNTGIFTSYPSNEIPMYAFYNPYLFTYKSTLTSIKFPSSTVSIGNLAFYYAWNLAGTITIPASIKSITDYAFYGCSSISAFSVVGSNTRYSSTAGVLFSKSQDTLFLFPQAKSGNYVIPSGVKHIGPSAFENCYYITSLTLPSTLQSIGSYAFCYCSGITGSLTLPSTLKKAGSGAFYGCWNITGTVTLPASLIDLGDFCFFESNNISAFNVNSSNPVYTAYNDVLYSKNMDTLFICPGGKTGTFTIPNSVKLIGSHAFYKCSKLTGTITIPTLVDYIGFYAFYGCSQLTNFQVNDNNPYFTAENGVLFSKNKDRLLSFPPTKSGNYEIPATVVQIDPGAFAFSSNITGIINIPASVKLLGQYAFYGCNQIAGFDVDTENKAYSSSDGILFNHSRDSLLICPLTKNGKYYIPTTVKYIGYSAFDGCNLLTEVILPFSVMTIDSYAFEYCTGLTRIRLSENVSTIGYGAFYNCTGLQKFEFNRSLPPVVDYYTLNLINKSTCSLVVPKGATSSYQNSNYWNEFAIITESDFLDTGLKLNNNNLKIFGYNRNIVIDGLETTDLIEIFNVQGVLLSKTIAKQKTFNFYTPSKGIYIVRIAENTYKLVM